ncbi:O-methyltransferase [Serratia fonticola AU-P3(3)]|nr:O-methyltransferase [Serratia fonticola AU-P3(3)]
MQQKWRQVDEYLKRQLLNEDPNLAQTLLANAAQGLPPHDVSPLQGQFLLLMVQISAAQRVLEIGTLGGFSTQLMAQALPPDGCLISLEKEERNAAVARENIARAGLSGKVTIKVGEAAELLPELQEQAPFDLVFIDADKQNALLYLQWSIRLGRTGSVIIMDNVIRGGAIIDTERDVHADGICQTLEAVKQFPELTATALQTVGEKGWDGFALLRVDKSSPKKQNSMDLP